MKIFLNGRFFNIVNFLMEKQVIAQNQLMWYSDLNFFSLQMKPFFHFVYIEQFDFFCKNALTHFFQKPLKKGLMLSLYANKGNKKNPS